MEGRYTMANINVTIRMDEKLKLQSEELFKDLGLSFSAAINMFIKQSVREQRIPFEIKRNVTCFQQAPDNKVEEISDQLIRNNYQSYKDLAK